MTLLSARERSTAEAIAEIGYCNPFLPERVELERRALGPKFIDFRPVMHLRPDADPQAMYPNVVNLRERAEQLAGRMRQRLVEGISTGENELLLYEDLVLFVLYTRHLSSYDGLSIRRLAPRENSVASKIWRAFQEDFQHYLCLDGYELPSRHNPAIIFAGLFQIHRAFLSIFEHIIGRSMPIAQLRAAAWQSIFSHDMRRYVRCLHGVMGDFPALILGPSGTGKEVVARAIGLSRFIPFDAQKEAFDSDAEEGFRALHLAALVPTLIEAELFGYRKGAFNGATSDRKGWLETSRPEGTTFLDEIGELEMSIQVKLLRVLQFRIFHRVGDTTARHFEGKIVAATNRNLEEEIRAGRFREDLYYRLCADIIHTPSLREQLAERPDDLPMIVTFLARRILQDAPEEADQLAGEVVAWIDSKLADYAWPGNIRELEQCVRNFMIRGCYRPNEPAAGSERTTLAADVAAGRLTLKELTQRYASLAYALDGSYRGAADRLGINWQTLRKHVHSESPEKGRNSGAGA